MYEPEAREWELKLHLFESHYYSNANNLIGYSARYLFLDK